MWQLFKSDHYSILKGEIYSHKFGIHCECDDYSRNGVQSAYPRTQYDIHNINNFYMECKEEVNLHITK